MSSDVKDRIRKLLELAKSSNEHEAANAAAKAAGLMVKHGIDSAELEDQNTVDDNRDLNVEVSRTRRLVAWKWNLAWFVGDAGQCKPYKLHRFAETTIVATMVAFIGRRSDADLCCQLFSYLLRELTRIHKDRRPPIGKKIQQYVPGAAPAVIDRTFQRRWSRSFYDGALTVIHQRMMAAREATIADEAAAAAEEERAAAAAAPPGQPAPDPFAPNRVEKALVILDKVAVEVDRVADELGLHYVDAPERQIVSHHGFSEGISAGRELYIDLPSDAPELPPGGVKKP